MSLLKFTAQEVCIPCKLPVINVRRALMTIPNEVNLLYDITGVITGKMLLEENYKEDLPSVDESCSFQSNKRSRTETLTKVESRCQLTLRDLKHTDTIAVYVTQSIADSHQVGSTVVITNCKLFISQGRKKKLYITSTNDKTRRFNIGKETVFYLYLYLLILIV